MPQITGVQATTVATERRTDLLKVKVTENDPTMKASASGFGFRLAGRASNNGVVASFLKLDFDGKSVNVSLSRGDMAPTVLAKLQKALPKGYEARVLQSFRNMPPELIIGIAKKGAASAGPTAKTLLGALHAYEFHAPNHQLAWKSKKPAGAVTKSIVVQKAPKTGPGFEITAHVLKSDPTKVYFERMPKMGAPRPGLIVNPPPGGFAPSYFGPVSFERVPA